MSEFWSTTLSLIQADTHPAGKRGIDHVYVTCELDHVTVVPWPAICAAMVIQAQFLGSDERVQAGLGVRSPTCNPGRWIIWQPTVMDVID